MRRYGSGPALVWHVGQVLIRGCGHRRMWIVAASGGRADLPTYAFITDVGTTSW
jgi:hypothetical protein